MCTHVEEARERERKYVMDKREIFGGPLALYCAISRAIAPLCGLAAKRRLYSRAPACTLGIFKLIPR